MIRLIASDLDGTLMHNDRSIPPEFYRLYHTLEARGIRFVAASGNQVSTLHDILDPIRSEVTCICDNGARILRGTQVLHEEAIPESALLTALDMLERFPQLVPVCSGADGALIRKSDFARTQELLIYLTRHQYVDDLRDHPQRIFKLAMCDPSGHIHEIAEQFRPMIPDGVRLVTSGNGWMDITGIRATKGSGLKWLQTQWGISPEETVVFGDQMNDVDMMAHAAHSYAMENADPNLKKAAKSIAPSNEQDGVLHILKQLL